MLKVRLIPTLLLQDGRCVKTKQFESPKDTGDPVKAAKVYDAQGADELLFLDISASVLKREILFDIIERVADECFMPLCVGGGLKTIEDIRQILRIGADKVALGSVLVENPALLPLAIRSFGSSTIVGIITYRWLKGKAKVFIHGKSKETDLDVVSFAQQLAWQGIGEILLYSIDRDGMMVGYDLPLIKQVSSHINIPLIVCGGVKDLDDFVLAVKEGQVSAVSAASIFHFTDQNLIKARAHMKNAGIDVRSV